MKTNNTRYSLKKEVYPRCDEPHSQVCFEIHDNTKPPYFTEIRNFDNEDEATKYLKKLIS